jgi:hypothetical protein
MAQVYARNRTGPAREPVLDLGEQEAVEQVVLEPEHDFSFGRPGGEPAVALAQHRQRSRLRDLGVVGVGP